MRRVVKEIFIFFNPFMPLLMPKYPVDVGDWFLEGEVVNRWGFEIDHLPPSNTMAKNSWNSASALLHVHSCHIKYRDSSFLFPSGVIFRNYT